MSFKAARKVFRDLIRIPKNLKQHALQDNENKKVVLNVGRSYGVLEVASAQIRPKSSIAKTAVAQSKRLQNAYCYIRTISKLFGLGNATKFQGFSGNARTFLQSTNRSSRFMLGAVGFAYFATSQFSENKANISDIVSCMQLFALEKSEIQNEASNEANIPSTLAEYSLKQRLGEASSSAAVYAAEYDGQEFAIKIMFNYDIASNASALMKGFSKECRVLSKENSEPSKDAVVQEKLPEHPNVIKVLDVLVEDTPCPYDAPHSYPIALPKRLNGAGRNKTLCLVMPKYSTTLRRYIGEGVQSEREKSLLLAQLLEGVAHLVEHDEAHRDLKSDNLLLDTTTTIKGCPQLVITDFGCCLGDKRLRLKLPFESDHVDRGGNSALMAPEIAAATPYPGNVLDYTKADIWACGTLAFEIFGQQNPFTHGTLDSRFYTEEEIPRLQCSNPLLVRLAQLLLKRDPDERPSASEAAIMACLILHAPEGWFKNDARSLPSENDVNIWLLAMWLWLLREERKFLNKGTPFTAELSLWRCFLRRASYETVSSALAYFKDECE